MCPRSQSWRAIGSHVQYDGTTDKYNEREKNEKKVLLWRPERPIKPPITPVSKRRACVFCYNPEKGAQTVLRSIFSNSCDVCIIKLQPLSFFFSVDQMCRLRYVKKNQWTTTHQRRHSEGFGDKRRHTHTVTITGEGREGEITQPDDEDTSSLHQDLWDCDILNGEVR